MSAQVRLVLHVVVPEEPDAAARLADLRGRELPGVPGSWVSHVQLLPPALPSSPATSRDAPGAPPSGGELEDEEALAEASAQAQQQERER